jgi:AcrR family transcriptional regulator
MCRVARVTRAESKELTRQRLLSEAERLFRERGYAATSLEQIAEAAEVTKGAIYGHFASKEDLMLSAIEASRDTTPDYVALLNDESRPLRERLAEFGRAFSAVNPGDTETLAMFLEFFAALLRAPEALQRYSDGLEHRIREIADTDTDEPAAGNTTAEVWAIGQALVVGLQIYQRMAPGLITPGAFERGVGLLASLYEEPGEAPLAARPED